MLPSDGWSCIKFHFFIKASFKVDCTEWVGTDIVSRKAIFLFLLRRCVSGVQLPLCIINFISDGRFSIKVCW